VCVCVPKESCGLIVGRVFVRGSTRGTSSELDSSVKILLHFCNGLQRRRQQEQRRQQQAAGAHAPPASSHPFIARRAIRPPRRIARRFVSPAESKRIESNPIDGGRRNQNSPMGIKVRAVRASSRLTKDKTRRLIGLFGRALTTARPGGRLDSFPSAANMDFHFQGDCRGGDRHRRALQLVPWRRRCRCLSSLPTIVAELGTRNCSHTHERTYTKVETSRRRSPPATSPISNKWPIFSSNCVGAGGSRSEFNLRGACAAAPACSCLPLLLSSSSSPPLLLLTTLAQLASHLPRPAAPIQPGRTGPSVTAETSNKRR
jgi:hypothetical protein